MYVISHTHEVERSIMASTMEKWYKELIRELGICACKAFVQFVAITQIPLDYVARIKISSVDEEALGERSRKSAR